MVTRSTPALIDIYQALEDSSEYGRVRRGGIVGDAAHRARGGYHISRQDQPGSNYSVQAPADRRGRSDIAAGIDITLGPADMRKMTGRLMAACKRNHADPSSEPRIEPIREFFGTLNNRTVTGWNRYPSSNRGVGYTSSDSSHLWHVHVSFFRDYADDPSKTAQVIDILLGRPLHPAPKPPQGDEEDVVTADDRKAIAAEVWAQFKKDGFLPAPVNAPSAKSNARWAGSSLLANPSVLLYSLHAKVGALGKPVTANTTGDKAAAAAAQADLDAIQTQLENLSQPSADDGDEPDDPAPLAAAAAADRGERDDAEPDA